MKYVYPAVFTPLEDGYDVYVPDLPGCRTCGDDLASAIEMAEDAVSLWLCEAEDDKMHIPPISSTIPHEAPQIVSYVMVDTDIYRRQLDNRVVKKTLSIPAWLNNKAEAEHVNFSILFQDALKEYLSISE